MTDNDLFFDMTKLRDLKPDKNLVWDKKENTMTTFHEYRRKQISELRSYTPGEDMSRISVSEVDAKNGSPRAGDMIARNPVNHNDQRLVAKKYFEDNFEPFE